MAIDKQSPQPSSKERDVIIDKEVVAGHAAILCARSILGLNDFADLANSRRNRRSLPLQNVNLPAVQNIIFARVFQPSFRPSKTGQLYPNRQGTKIGAAQSGHPPCQL